MYNPLLHKTPYGGTAVGKPTTITFPLEANMGIKRVFIILRNDEENMGKYPEKKIETTLIVSCEENCH